MPAGLPAPGAVVVSTLSLPMDFGFFFVPALLWVIVTSMAWVASTAEATPTMTSAATIVVTATSMSLCINPPAGWVK